MAGGSASALSLSRPAQASLALRPAGSLSRPRRPLSRGSDPASYPTKPLASFRTYRQLSGWNPPPLMIRAFGAHCQQQKSCAVWSRPDANFDKPREAGPDPSGAAAGSALTPGPLRHSMGTRSLSSGDYPNTEHLRNRNHARYRPGTPQQDSSLGTDLGMRRQPGDTR